MVSKKDKFELLSKKISDAHVDCVLMGNIAATDVSKSKLINKKEIGIEILYFLKLLGKFYDVQRNPDQIVAIGNSLVNASKDKKSPNSLKLFADDI